MGEKYFEFADEDGSVVYDVDEERALMDRLREQGLEELPEDKKRQVRRTPEGISATGNSS